MRTQVRKIIYTFIALCMTLTMVLSSGFIASADEFTSGSTGIVTISGTEAKGQLTTYKVINVNVQNNQPTSPVYSWADAIKPWVQENYPAYTSNGEVTQTFLDLTDLSEFVDKLAYEIKTNSTTAAALATDTKTINSQSMQMTLPLGSYLFLVKGAEKIYSPGFASIYPVYESNAWTTSSNEINISLKSEEVQIEKIVNDYSFEIGQTVSYTLKVDVPQYPANATDKKMIVADYISNGLSFKAGSVKMYMADSNGNQSTTEITDFVDYSDNTTLLPTAPEGTTLAFAYSISGDILDTLGDYIFVTYQATVTKEAIVLPDNSTDNNLNNTAYLIYSNDPYGNGSYEVDDTKRVYTYGMEVQKLDETTKEPLSNAQFTLTDANDNNVNFVEVSSNVYRVTQSQGITTLVTGTDGKFTITGLDLGTYTLTETKAPDGYALPKDPEQDVTLTDTNTDGILDNDTDGTQSFTVYNMSTDFVLPQTGGMGTLIFTTTGIILMGSAVVLVLYTFKSRKASEQ